MNIHTILLSILFANFIAFIPVGAATEKLVARPTLYTYLQADYNYLPESLEWADLQNLTDQEDVQYATKTNAIANEMCILQRSLGGQTYDTAKYNSLCKKLHEETNRMNEIRQTLRQSQLKVCQKLRAIIKSIAERLGASAVLSYTKNYEEFGINYIDPAYEITQEAIDTLNKEYLAER